MNWDNRDGGTGFWMSGTTQSEGNLVTGDYYNSYIQEFTKDGKYVITAEWTNTEDRFCASTGETGIW